MGSLASIAKQDSHYRSISRNGPRNQFLLAWRGSLAAWAAGMGSEGLGGGSGCKQVCQRWATNPMTGRFRADFFYGIQAEGRH